jgi:hypothetical protein
MTELHLAKYKELREAYRPERIKAIFVLESPPKSGKYFYNPDGTVHEQLFRAMMEFIDVNPPSKQDGLHAFRDQGFIVVDASYAPVNDFKGKARDAAILREYDSLLRDLSLLNPRKDVPLILVKANVCKLLAKRLKEAGFLVANNDIEIPFPGSGRQKGFRDKLAAVVETAGLKLTRSRGADHADHKAHAS